MLESVLTFMQDPFELGKLCIVLILGLAQHWFGEGERGKGAGKGSCQVNTSTSKQAKAVCLQSSRFCYATIDCPTPTIIIASDVHT